MTQQQLEDTLNGQNKILSYLQSLSIIDFKKTYIPVPRNLTKSEPGGAIAQTAAGTIAVPQGMEGTGTYLQQQIPVKNYLTSFKGERITVRLLLSESSVNIIENLKFTLLLDSTDTLLEAKASIIHAPGGDSIEVLFEYPVHTPDDVLNVKVELKDRGNYPNGSPIVAIVSELYTWKSTEVFSNFTDQGLGYIFPQWFGVKGDGITEDADGFQKAIDEAIKLKKTLFLPQGNYRISGQLNINNGKLSILGTGETSVFTLTTDNALFKLFQNEPVNFDNFKIQGIVGAVKASAWIIDFFSVPVINTGSRFTRLITENLGFSFSLMNCAEVEISNCFLNSTTPYCIFNGNDANVAPNAKGATIRNCTFKGATQYFIMAGTGENLWIKDNVFVGNDTLQASIYVWQRIAASNLKITGNKFGATAKNSITLSTIDASKILSNVNISNNEFLDPSTNDYHPDIDISGAIQYVTIQNNNITNKWTAVSLSGIQNIILSDNIIKSPVVGSTSSQGFYLDNCTGSIYEQGNILIGQGKANVYTNTLLKSGQITKKVTVPNYSGTSIKILTNNLELEKNSVYVVGVKFKTASGFDYQGTGTVPTGDLMTSAEFIPLAFNTVATGFAGKTVEWKWQGTGTPNSELQFKVVGDATPTPSLEVIINYSKLL